MEGEGHFIALLKKEEEAVSENLKEKKKTIEIKMKKKKDYRTNLRNF